MKRPASAALLILLGVCAGGVGGATLATRATADTPWLGRTGAEWKAMTPPERRAWMEGFLSGSAAANALATGPADSAAFVTAVARLHRAGEFRFPYAPPVYAARLDDYFQWDNHTQQPVWYGIWVVDAEQATASGASRH